MYSRARSCRYATLVEVGMSRTVYSFFLLLLICCGAREDGVGGQDGLAFTMPDGTFRLLIDHPQAQG